MKETLDEQSRLGLMHYRMERADEALEEAAILSAVIIMLLSTDFTMPVSMLFRLFQQLKE